MICDRMANLQHPQHGATEKNVNGKQAVSQLVTLCYDLITYQQTRYGSTTVNSTGCGRDLLNMSVRFTGSKNAQNINQLSSMRNSHDSEDINMFFWVAISCWLAGIYIYISTICSSETMASTREHTWHHKSRRTSKVIFQNEQTLKWSVLK